MITIRVSVSVNVCFVFERVPVVCPIITDGALRYLLGAGSGQVADDGGVGVEEIITGHAGLAGDTSGDDNDIAASKSLLEAVVLGNVARNLCVSTEGRWLIDCIRWVVCRMGMTCSVQCFSVALAVVAVVVVALRIFWALPWPLCSFR